MRALIRGHLSARRDDEWRQLQVGRLIATGTEDQVRDWFADPDPSAQGPAPYDDETTLRRDLAALGLTLQDDPPDGAR